MNRESGSSKGSAVPAFRQEVGTRLREIESRFKNRQEAAAAAGVSKSAFQSWVFGQADPSFEGLARLARRTGCSLDWLATGEGPTEVERPQRRRLGAFGTVPLAAPGQPRIEAPPAGFDRELMATVVRELEDWLQAHGKRLASDKKAEATLLLYDIIMKERAAEGEVDAAQQVDRVLRLVA